jgi:U4/U6.U5 tri-snRNP-associated protein 1
VVSSVSGSTSDSHLHPEDELQNIEMAEDERTKKNNEMKIKKRDYTGYDDDEFVAGNEGMKRAVLAKYDEDIEGTRDTVSVIRFFSY